MKSYKQYLKCNSLMVESPNTKEEILSLLDYPENEKQTKNNFLNLSKDKKQEVINKLENINKHRLKNEMYHGTTNAIADEIKKNGFKLTKGQRSGFMGSDKTVENLGIFLSDDSNLAKGYGVNRDKHDGRDTAVLTVIPNINKTLDMTKWDSTIPLSIRKLGLVLVSEEEGKNIKKPAQSDMFWLADQKEFIDKIKTEGYDSIKFKESSATKKALGVAKSDANTYMVFDPDKIKIKKGVKTFRDLVEYLGLEL